VLPSRALSHAQLDVRATLALPRPVDSGVGSVPIVLRRFFGGGGSSGDPLDTRLKLPAHAISVQWVFPERCASLEFDVTIHDDPGEDVGEYLSPFNGEIDGAQIYFGIQTDVFRPGSPEPGYPTGVGIGKGLIFSTWWTFDAADTRVPDDGFIQLGTHEGRFVGVRRGFDWGVGDYRVRLTRGEAAGDGDWFDYFIVPIEERFPGSTQRPAVAGEEVWIGSLRFRRARADRPATISSRGSAFLEVYSDADTFRDIIDWHADLQGYADGARSLTSSVAFTDWPNKQVIPNADSWFDPERDRVHVAFGAGVTRLHAAGTLY
jgi:hypothetical protein